MGSRTTTKAPALVAGALVVLAALALAIEWPQLSEPSDLLEGYAIDGLMWSLVIGLIGALVLRDSPENRLGPLLAATGLWAALGNVCGALAPLLELDSIALGVCTIVSGLWTVIACAFFTIPLIYPYGAPMSPRWRLPLRVSIGCSIGSSTALLLSPEIGATDADGQTIPNPLGIEALSPQLAFVASLLLGIVLLIGLAALVGQAVRARQLNGDERARVAWLGATLTLVIAAIFVSDPWANFAVQLAAACCLGIGVVRHQLFDIQRVLSRSVVYSLIVLAALLAAVVTAAVLGSLSRIGVLPAVAAAVTALLLAGAVGQITVRVDRLLFGPHADAVAALEVLGDRLAAAQDPEEVLPGVVVTVRETLRLPYAAIVLAGEDDPVAFDGEPGPGLRRGYPLRYGGQPVGALELSLRPGESELSPREARLVASLAAQAGSAAHNAQTLRELRRSREALVTAREEERRSLRHDLHDGLGPSLAGMALGLESLARDAATDDQARIASDVLAQARQGLEEVRRMASELRPAPLDELGLVEALHQHVARVERMAGGRTLLEVTQVGAIPALPAAVEVAAYRIVQEAVTNATRHAGASTCLVELSANGSLVVRVTDDGSGAAPAAPGTGLRSMRARATELGGACTVTFRAGAGTTVLAELPLGHRREPATDDRGTA